MNEKIKNAVSLFCSSGIGDIALRKEGYRVIVANELLENRCNLYKQNFKETHLIVGDINKKTNEIINKTLSLLNGKKLHLALVSPPCQGMSKNGRGKLISEIRKGNRPKEDPRNLLIIPSVKILKKIKPETIIFENVSEMKETLIVVNNKPILIIDYISRELKDYDLDIKVLNFADYGIPQNRKRLITIATKNKNISLFLKKYGTIFPEITHGKKNNKLKPFVTVRDKISKMEKLDGLKYNKSKYDPLHRVPQLDDKKYIWISNTPENRSAFDNQCIKCGYNKNPTHFSRKNNDGINKPSKKTPLYCIKCNALLPRPFTEKNGKKKIMNGFTSAYKRMDWDKPASTITRNFAYVMSDNKIHPDQHRALSIREACLLHTIDKTDFNFFDSNETLIRDTIGESIPPKMISTLINNLDKISQKKKKFKLPTQVNLIFT